MSRDSPLLYGLEFQARSLSQAVHAEKTLFLVGTQSLKMTNNQVHLVELNEEENTLIGQVYSHKYGEIWSLSNSPKDTTVFSSCYSCIKDNPGDSNYQMKCALWKLPDVEDTDLILLQEFNTQEYGSNIMGSIFHPNDDSQIAVIVDNNVVIYDVNKPEQNPSSVISIKAKGQPKLTTGTWNFPMNSQFATAHDSTVKGWDIREPSTEAWNIDNAHLQIVRDLDFNPNKHNILATCGDDGRSRFWDLRKLTEPLISRSDHSHWVWSIKFNHYHDELVATASSDNKVIITCLQSISSSTFYEEDKDRETLTDGVTGTFDQHEDSVYAVQWSCVDPWILASLSYDGRLLVNKVPKEEKYKILF